MLKFDSLGDDHGSLRSVVFRKLESAILDGTFKSGDSLSEIKLSSELGVSRTPVREALKQLELEGLVHNVPNKGAVVVGISNKDIGDIYAIRTYIEGLAAKWAAENINEQELAELENIVELQEYYASKGDSMQVWNLDSKFHEIIYESSRSRTLKTTLSNFHHYLQKSRELSMKKGDRAMFAATEHRGILEAIKKHDPNEAERLAGEHVRKAYDNLMNAESK